MESITAKKKWLVEFALVILIPIALLGLGLGASQGRKIEDRALKAAADRATLVYGLALTNRLTESGLEQGLPPREREALTAALRASLEQGAISRVRVWNRESELVYADDNRPVQRTPGISAALNAALAGGSVWEVAPTSPRPGSVAGGRALKVFLPIHLAATSSSGVAEVWLPYEPIAAAIKRDKRSLYLILTVGLLLLWGSLFGIVIAASQALRRKATDKEQEALRDGLTGLPNRTLFNDLLQRAVRTAGRKQGRLAVMLMDLDRFKEINDSLGHHNGDLLLQRLASRLQGVLRDSETIARLGGDEFAVLLPEISDRSSVLPVVQRVLKTVEEPVAVGGLALRVEASIGIAMFPEQGKQVTDLIRAADVAMYTAKQKSGGYEFYVAEQERHDAGRLALVGELRRAMDEAELVLHYQPKANLETGQVRGVEALARWRHPSRGLLSPDEFIPLAEHSNLLRPMTLYLLDTALRQCGAWRSRGLEINVAVNLSMQNLLDSRLPSDLDRLLSSWRLPPGALELEITESTLMSDPKRAMEILTRLSGMGISLAIDDFGTGYSSLAYLRRLPVSSIKIDKSFVMNMAEDEGNATIVQSTVDLGHNLGLKVVAEGVETQSVYGKLAALGCDYAQGYFLSKPLPPDKMTLWLEVFMSPSTAGPAEPAPRSDDDSEAELMEWVVA